MKRIALTLLLTLTAGVANATPISFSGIGFYGIAGDSLVFSTTYGAPTNNGPFTGAAISVGQITLAPTVTAADWTIGGYQYVVESVQVFTRDIGLDFLLKGTLYEGAQESGSLKIFMETNIAGVFQFARVPEPTTLAMMLVGVCGLVAMRRRQYQRAA